MQSSSTTFNPDDFQEWEKGLRGSTSLRLPFNDTPSMYVTRAGVIYFSKAAYDIMGKPKYIKILIASNRLAFRVGGPADGYKTTYAKSGGHCSFQPVRLIEKFHLAPKEGMVLFTASVDDRTIIVQLNQKPLPAEWEAVE